MSLADNLVPPICSHRLSRAVPQKATLNSLSASSSQLIGSWCRQLLSVAQSSAHLNNAPSHPCVGMGLAIESGHMQTALPDARRTPCPGSLLADNAHRYTGRICRWVFGNGRHQSTSRVDGVWVKLVALSSRETSWRLGLLNLGISLRPHLPGSSLPQRLLLGKGDSGSRDGFHRLRFHVLLGRSCPRRRSSESACLFSDATFR